MARFDPNGAQAGSYELLDLFWDRPTSKPGDPGHPTYERVHQGEVVELDQAEAQRLVRAGSVVPEGQREERLAALAEQRFVLELNQLSPETRERVIAGLKKSAVPEGLVEGGGVVVQDQPGFRSPEPAQRVNAEGDGGPDPQTGDEQPDAAAGRVDTGAQLTGADVPGAAEAVQPAEHTTTRRSRSGS